MHLLNATTKKLESFYSEKAPSYAILSHMWGRDGDEVLFSHLMGSDDTRREGEKRRGYAKIEGACKQAIEDGFKYIWIDTCCINKESSAELSEAINSMYKWYEKAAVCYVYLEDVQSSRSDQNNPSKDVQMNGNDKDNPFKIVPFEHSRWFSRGWTLQELIAPRHIVFYSRNWIDIGTKASLRDAISATTHIRVEMLMAYDPKKASVAERMSWAALRETTRMEDIAYCLMGLFGVNMPLLYGEGDRAFRRLQEEIMKESDDHSLFAWKGKFGNSSYGGSDSVYGKTRGILAYSPWNFRDGMDIVPSNDGAYSPYSMTNQGLQIQLPLEPINSSSGKNVFKTTLKCTIRNKQPTRWIVIYLEMDRKGYYQRIFHHWLDETEINPNECELTSLLIPQVETRTPSSYDSYAAKIRVLSTESGHTVNGRSLVQGYEEPSEHLIVEVPKFTVFNGLDGSCFAVVIGVRSSGLPWLDVMDVHEEWSHPQKRKELKHEIKKDYEEGGCKRNLVLQHRDWLFMNISNDWSVVVSVKKFMEHNARFSSLSCFCATVNIQRRWYGPPLMSTVTSADSYGSDFSTWGYRDSFDHSDFKEEHSDWIVVFNPRAKVNVNLIHNITSHLPTNPPEHPNKESFLRFSPDGNYLAFTYEKTIQVYDTNTGAEKCLLSDEMHSDVGQICLSPDGKFLAASMLFEPSHNREIKLWDIEKGHICEVSSGRLDIVNDLLSLCFSDNRHIISGSGDGKIRIWDIIANETSEILTMDTDPRCIEFSRDGRLVAVLSENYDIVQIWDVMSAQLLKELKFEKVFENRIPSFSFMFTPDGKGLLVGGVERGLEYWDVGELVSAQANMVEGFNRAEIVNGSGVSGVRVQGETRRRIISKDDAISTMAVSHNAQWVIFESYYGSVLFCSLKDSTTQFVLHWGYWDSTTSVDMSPVGNIFATYNQDGTVRIWSYDTTLEQ